MKSHCAICWEDNNTNINIFIYINYSFIITKIIRWNQSAGNQKLIYQKLIYNNISSLVDTSETTRAVTYSQNKNKNININKNNKNIYFYQWLAGIIDATGSFEFKKNGNSSIHITISQNYFCILVFIKDIIKAGSIKKRSGGNSYRYKLTTKNDIIKIINNIQGFIQDAGRIAQFHRICQQFNIKLYANNNINNDYNCSWFAGYLDANAKIYINNIIIPAYPIKVDYNSNNFIIETHSDKIFNILKFYNIFGGNILYDSARNGFYKWQITNSSDIIKVYNYYINNSNNIYNYKPPHISFFKNFYSINKYKLNFNSINKYKLL